MFGYDGEYPTGPAYFDISARKSRKLTVKYSKEKPIFLNFVNLSTIFFPRL